MFLWLLSPGRDKTRLLDLPPKKWTWIDPQQHHQGITPGQPRVGWESEQRVEVIYFFLLGLFFFFGPFIRQTLLLRAVLGPRQKWEFPYYPLSRAQFPSLIASHTRVVQVIATRWSTSKDVGNALPTMVREKSGPHETYKCENRNLTLLYYIYLISPNSPIKKLFYGLLKREKILPINYKTPPTNQLSS